MLNQYFTHHTGMRGRTASGDDDLLDAFCKFRRQVELRQPHQAIFKVDAPCQGIIQRANLLVDFLLHKVAVFTFFRGNRIPGYGVHFILHFFTVQGHYLHAAALYHSHLS